MEGLVRAAASVLPHGEPDRLPEFVGLLKEALVMPRGRVAVVIAGSRARWSPVPPEMKPGAIGSPECTGAALRERSNARPWSSTRGEPGSGSTDDLHRLRRLRSRLPGGGIRTESDAGRRS